MTENYPSMIKVAIPFAGGIMIYPFAILSIERADPVSFVVSAIGIAFLWAWAYVEWLRIKEA